MFACQGNLLFHQFVLRRRQHSIRFPPNRIQFRGRLLYNDTEFTNMHSFEIRHGKRSQIILQDCHGFNSPNLSQLRSALIELRFPKKPLESKFYEICSVIILMKPASIRFRELR